MLRSRRLPPQLRRVLHIGCRRVFGLLHLHLKHIARTDQIARKEHHRLVRREPHIRLLTIIVVTHVHQVVDSSSRTHCSMAARISGSLPSKKWSAPGTRTSFFGCGKESTTARSASALA